MESVQLIGVEEVRTAGYAMERAADKFANSAAQIASALRDHQIWMETWLERFESVVRSLHATENTGQ